MGRSWSKWARQDQTETKNIISEYKVEIKNTEEEIAKLKEQYQQESLENQIYFETGGLAGTQEHGTDHAQDGKEGVIYQKEQELKEIKNTQNLDERSHLKLVKTLQDSFATVSRIMYQLEPSEVKSHPI